jgi:hypothetical protein
MGRPPIALDLREWFRTGNSDNPSESFSTGFNSSETLNGESPLLEEQGRLCGWSDRVRSIATASA